MKEKDATSLAYAPGVIEFVTVAVEFCAYLEKEETDDRTTWQQTMLRMLPLLYLKAALLPETVDVGDLEPETFVREEDYMRVLAAVVDIMGEEDVYLDAFVEDMKYSDTPVSASVSEDIADIYQDVRNFVSVYQLGLEEQMIAALLLCSEHFRAYWGQKLVNVLRPLHAAFYAESFPGEVDDEQWEGDYPA